PCGIGIINMSTRLLRRDEVEHQTGLRRSTLYDAIRAGTFPRPVPLTATARAWRSDEVEAWIAAKIAARDQGHAP
ncbi:Prophage CP4-57 regulatory, partial [mine drainage metagenome]